MDEHNTDIEQQSTGANHKEKHYNVLKSTDPASDQIKSMPLPQLEHIDEVVTPPDTRQVVGQVETGKKTQITTEETHQPLSAFTKWLLSQRESSELIIQVKKQGESGEVSIQPESTTEVEHHDYAPNVITEPKAKKKDKKSKKKKKKKSKSKGKSKKGGESGVLLSESVVSETLAELLESQGHYEQAIAMYDKLRLKYPEKSRFFADRIEKLRSLNG